MDIVLVGGGACGEWQGGALEAFHDAGLLNNTRVIVGTSVGGLNACMLAVSLAQGLGVKGLKDAWASITKDEDVYTPGLTAVMLHPALHPIDDAELTHGFLAGPSTCDTSPLVDFVKKHIGDWTADRVLAACGIKVLTRALNYEDQRAETLTGDLGPMALCTSAVEGVFPRRWGRGDGGAVDNAPIDTALAEGCDQILVVYCGPENPAPAVREPSVVRWTDDPGKSSTGFKDALGVLSGITLANEDLVDQAATRAEAAGLCKVVHCYPQTSTRNFLDFSKRGLWERGVKEAAKAIGEAKALGW